MDALGLKSYTAFRGGIRFLVLLYSAKTGELKALIQAQRLGELRTAGVAGVAISRWRARRAPGRGLRGGEDGRAMLEAMVLARDFRRIKVLNTLQERLSAYCAEMSERLDIEIIPAADAAMRSRMRMSS